MRFHDDPLHIQILNDNHVCHLLEEPDEHGRNLLAGLVARVSPGQFNFPELGSVELRASVKADSALLAIKIDNRAAAAAGLFWGTSASDESWEDLQALHGQLTGCARPTLPPSPPAAPWLGISFFPEFHRSFTPEQRLIAVSMLWGLSYGIRRQIQSFTTKN